MPKVPETEVSARDQVKRFVEKLAEVEEFYVDKEYEPVRSEANKRNKSESNEEKTDRNRMGGWLNVVRKQLRMHLDGDDEKILTTLTWSRRQFGVILHDPDSRKQIVKLLKTCSLPSIVAVFNPGPAATKFICMKCEGSKEQEPGVTLVASGGGKPRRCCPKCRTARRCKPAEKHNSWRMLEP